MRLRATAVPRRAQPQSKTHPRRRPRLQPGDGDAGVLVLARTECQWEGGREEEGSGGGRAGGAERQGDGVRSSPFALRLLINSLFHAPLLSPPLPSSLSVCLPSSPSSPLCLPCRPPNPQPSPPAPTPTSAHTHARARKHTPPLSRALKDGGIPTFLRCYSNTAARTGKRGRRQGWRRRRGGGGREDGDMVLAVGARRGEGDGVGGQGAREAAWDEGMRECC